MRSIGMPMIRSDDGCREDPAHERQNGSNTKDGQADLPTAILGLIVHGVPPCRAWCWNDQPRMRDPVQANSGYLTPET